MYKYILKLVFLTTLFFSLNAIAAPIETFKFDSPENEKIFHKLSEELRCLVCQNQNIAESNADLAKDLRLEIHTMLTKGKTEKEIVDFMVQRYGDYVLYRPPFKPMTWLLWFGPLIAFIVGLIFVIRYMKSQNTNVKANDLSQEDIERIKNLHAEQDKQ
ncbi:Cytochrome c heme lyase subunit CcmL [hydrothermal vent metagenome]|uniref:Cytochrome c heme lyase subunit CcmL n=1 Tax=hydrothermal vent metagenome TaxID=652676 RepID=A0A3B0WQM1_9ZZZZ